MPSVDDDYYELFGISEHASDDEIRKAWRALAQKWHPDRAGPSATFIFQRLTDVYDVLADPVKRAAYDRKRGTPPRPAPADRESPPPVGRRAPGELLRRVSAPLDALLARGVARVGDDGVIELFLEGDEISEGGMVVISMRVPVREGGDDVFSAWLAVRPGTQDGTILKPSAQLPNIVQPVSFRVRCSV